MLISVPWVSLTALSIAWVKSKEEIITLRSDLTFASIAFEISGWAVAGACTGVAACGVTAVQAYVWVGVGFVV